MLSAEKAFKNCELKTILDLFGFFPEGAMTSLHVLPFLTGTLRLVPCYVAVGRFKKPRNLDTFTREQIAVYDGVYLCGGHGAIGDMPKSDALVQIFRWVLELNIPIAAVCHGHCGLLNLRNGEGTWPFAGYRLTAFSHAEELVTNMAGRLPFVLEVELKRFGGLYEKADAIWDSHVVVDRNLITGQNPYSFRAIAKTIVN